VVLLARCWFLLLSALPAPAAGNGLAAADYAAWRPLLAAELERSAGAVQAEDLYKFLHQGVLGPAHAVVDTAPVRAWLQREWAQTVSLPAAGRPPLLLPLRPDGDLVRVDLVRLQELARDHDLGAAATAALQDTLLEAFAATAAAWPRRPEALANLWQAVLTDTTLWHEHLTGDALLALTRDVAEDWPAVHHSQIYRERWRPHYRVVDRGRLPGAWRRFEETP